MVLNHWIAFPTSSAQATSLPEARRPFVAEEFGFGAGLLHLPGGVAVEPLGAEPVSTVIVGGGQSGLAVAAHLQRAGRAYVILDASSRVGDAWRNRWDSLRLFTPAWSLGMPGTRFPDSAGSFPTKDAMADYLEQCASDLDRGVELNTRVDGVHQLEDGNYVVTAGERTWICSNVVVAMANYQIPHVPDFASLLSEDIVQLHSSEYRSPDQLQPGPVVVVGAGNSGAEIALEVASQHPTTLCGTESAVVPFRPGGFIARHLLIRIVRFVGHHVLSVRSPVGRKVRPSMMAKATPLIRVKPSDLAEAGVTRTGRVLSVSDGLPLVEEGTIPAKNVIWCTGYRPGFDWLHIPVLDDDDEPQHHSGIVDSHPGLYFVGLSFLHAATSDTATGMQRDARRIANRVIKST